MLHLTAKNFSMEINKSSLPVVVMFSAAWCGKCAKPLVEDMEPSYKNRVLFCEVEVDESARLADRYNATSIVPTFAFFQNGRLLGELHGVMEDTTLEKHIQKIFRNC